jgi:radical SAM superfamily enzyme YgiQ (UPF0313 family)
MTKTTLPFAVSGTLDKKAIVSSSENTQADIDFHEFLLKFKQFEPKRLVLIQPALVPEKFFDIKTARSGGYYNFPPIGLLYLAAAVKNTIQSLDVSIVDLNYEMLKHAHDEKFNYQNCLAECLSKFKEDSEGLVFGISFMFGTTKPCFIETALLIRDTYPNSPILAGGVQATFDAVETINSDLVDFCAVGEGEEQLSALIKSLHSPINPATPYGAYIKLGNKAIKLGQVTSAPTVDFDLRDVYSLIPIEDYHLYGSLGAFSRFVGSDLKFSTVLSRRGCRARCTFCTVRNFNGLGVRKRGVQGVIDELKYLVHVRKINYIDWLDDDLLFDREQVLSLFKEIAIQVPSLKWTASNGLIGVSIDDEVMDAMANSGLQAYKIGIESGNDKILHQIKKPTTKKKLRERIEIFTKYKHIFFSTNLILGFPEETFSEMLDTFFFAQELKQDWASFYIMQPLKGTEMYSSFQSLGDERCTHESYDKTINPGRSSERGEFGYQFNQSNPVMTGWDIFTLSLDVKPNLAQQKEIWFTFNLAENFLNNPNYSNSVGTEKLLRWLGAIYSAYPYDASMVAAISHCYKLLGNDKEHLGFLNLFLELTSESSYWRSRCQQFPQLFTLAGISSPPEWFKDPVPQHMYPSEFISNIQNIKNLNEAQH